MANNYDETGRWRRDKDGAVKWALEKAGGMALGLCVWLVTGQYNLRERLISIEIHAEQQREQIAELRAALNQSSGANARRAFIPPDDFQ